MARVLLVLDSKATRTVHYVKLVPSAKVKVMCAIASGSDVLVCKPVTR